MKEQKAKFKTHIPEPRWQQIASVVVVVCIILIELLFALKIL